MGESFREQVSVSHGGSHSFEEKKKQNSALWVSSLAPGPLPPTLLLNLSPALGNAPILSRTNPTWVEVSPLCLIPEAHLSLFLQLIPGPQPCLLSVHLSHLPAPCVVSRLPRDCEDSCSVDLNPLWTCFLHIPEHKHGSIKCSVDFSSLFVCCHCVQF